MRIGLDFRFLGLDRQNGVRGIPRFTQEQLHAVLALDRETTYLLLCDPGNDLRALRPEIRAAPNAQIVCAPDAAPPAFSPSDDPRRLLARYSAYQRWIESLGLDLYHATCHFWVSRLIMPGFDACPYVVTAYDLMPLLYPAQVGGELAEAYQRGLLFLEQAARVGAISHATAGLLVEHLRVPADRVDLTRPAISPSFRRIPRDVARSILASLDHPARRRSRRRVRIPGEYVLCVTDLHYTKNLPTLVAAYAELAPATRARFPLVIAGHLSKHDMAVLQRFATSLDMSRDVILTGRVSDHELMALYNAATVMVHPSHHEGFGLTVAEAMRCGAPVITTTRSALPEVAGDAALLVDSEDQSAFTEALEEVLHDDALRGDMSRRGTALTARFTTQALGEATLRLYEAALRTARAPATRPIRVALWSPVAAESSAVTEHTADLAGGLASEPGVLVDVFVDDGVAPPLELSRLACVRHRSDHDRSARHAPYDVSIYELGASPLHRYIEQAALVHPGVAVLHDLEWSGIGPVVETATCCVLPTPEAAAELRRRFPRADVRVVPVGVRDPTREGAGFDRDMARAYLALDSDAFVVVAPEPAAGATRIDAVLDAVAGLRRSGANAVLAVIGSVETAAHEPALRHRAESLGISHALRQTGPLPRADFDAYLAACDAALVLGDRRGSATPSDAWRALAAGRVVVVGAGAAAPPGSDVHWLRAAPPPRERAEVTAALVALAADPVRRHGLEQAARAHYETAARPDLMITGYASLIREQAGRAGAGAGAAVALDGTALDARPAARPGPLPYCKVCELEDFAHPELVDVIRHVRPHKRAVFGPSFPRGFEHREDWEDAMAVRTLADHGVLRRDARVLAVGPGTPDTVLYVTRLCGEVVAADTREWRPGPERAAARDGHTDAAAPFAFRAERLTVRHLDVRFLDYPDAYFDAILTWSLEDLARHAQGIAAVLSEMERVLRPGGILSLTTEIQLSVDPLRQPRSPRTPAPASDVIQRAVAQAGGLEPLAGMDLAVSHPTRATSRDAARAFAVWRARRARQPEGVVAPDWTYWDLPHIVVERRGRRYTSAHMAWRRTAEAFGA